MKLNQLIYAVIDPATERVLGDGECPALHSIEPTPDDIERVRLFCSCPAATVVRCVLVEAE